MLKKILFIFGLFVFSQLHLIAQTINVSNISATGHFDPNNPQGGGCGVLPTITATYLSGTGTTLTNGTIVCNDPCGFTTIRINMTNVRWSKTSTINWLHGISFTPGNVTVNVPSGGLPSGWAPFNSSTGSSCSSGLTTGVGFYFDGTTGNSCCPGNANNDMNPSNNYGDVTADCGLPFAFFFDLTFCNNLITANPLLFSTRGTSDYQTGCWSVVDPIGTSKIQFVVATTACTQPIFSTLPTATIPTKSCAGGTVNYTSTLTSACGSGTAVTWWTAATGGTQVGSGSPFVYDPAGSACPSGTTLYAACCPVGSTCVTRRAVTIVGVCDAALDITNVNKTDPTCTVPTGSINSVTVTGNAGPVFYTLNPGNITNSTGIFLGLTGLNYTLTAADDAGCSKTVPVTFTPSGTGGTPPTVTTPVVYCQNQTTPPVVALSANTTVAGGVLSWFLPGSTIGQPNAPIPATNAAGIFVYNVTQTVGTCVSAQVPITVTINATPLAPTANSPISYCQSSTATATALVATPNGSNILKWYSTATSTSPLPSAPTPSITTVGTISYYVSQTAGACEGPRKQIDVIVKANPLPPTVTASITYCEGAAAAVLTAGGTGILWYTTLTGLPAGTSTTPTVNTNVVATSIYYVSQTVNGCESNRATITVEVKAKPAPPTTLAVNYCQNATTTPLTATTISGATVLWYTDPITGVGDANAPFPITTTAGTFTYYVSQTVNGCVSNRVPLVVKVIGTPSAPTVAAPSLVYCKGAIAVPLSVQTGINLLWYNTLTLGTGNPTAPTPQTTSVGSSNYYVSQSTTGSTTVPVIPACESQRATIIVTVNDKPNAPTVQSPLAFCQNVIISPLTAQGSALKWYAELLGGQSSTIAIPSSLQVGSTTYYVSQTVNNCESDRAGLVVNISPALTANAGAPITIAAGATTQLNATATVGASYLWTSNILPLTLSSTTILNPIANPAATTTYKITVSDPTNLCPSVNSSITVTVIESCINVRNAFSPNGDGINDKWLLYDQNFCLAANNGVNVSVFNRYGTKVFESSNYTNNWDGTFKGNPLPDGTYYAVIEFTLFDGRKQYKKTDLTIIR